MKTITRFIVAIILFGLIGAAFGALIGLGAAVLFSLPLEPVTYIGLLAGSFVAARTYRNNTM